MQPIRILLSISLFVIAMVALGYPDVRFMGQDPDVQTHEQAFVRSRCWWAAGLAALLLLVNECHRQGLRDGGRSVSHADQRGA